MLKTNQQNPFYSLMHKDKRLKTAIARLDDSLIFGFKETLLSLYKSGLDAQIIASHSKPCMVIFHSAEVIVLEGHIVGGMSYSTMSNSGSWRRQVAHQAFNL